MAHLSEKIVQKICDRHGAYDAQQMVMGSTSVVRGICPKCKEERDMFLDRMKKQREEKEREEAEERKAELTKKWREESQVPRRYRDKTLADFVAETDAMQKAHQVAIDFLELLDKHLQDGTGLTFMGRLGTGKSLLAMAIVNEAIERVSAVYVTAPELIREVRSMWKTGGDEQSVYDKYNDASLLVIDEIGAQSGSENEQNILFSVLDKRYRDMRPTILVTNEDAAGLKHFLGERSYDRLKENSKSVMFAWESYRRKARAA